MIRSGSSNGSGIAISPPMATFDFTEDERAALSQFLRQAIEADRYPMSPRWRPIKAALANLDPPPSKPELPRPTAKPYVPSTVLQKKGRRRSGARLVGTPQYARCSGERLQDRSKGWIAP
jgi:hypothetical protein